MTKFYETNQQNSRENSALERAIIESEVNTFLFSVPAPSVFLGTTVSSNLFVQNNKENIEMARYNGSCGALYLDENNIKVNLLVPGKGYITARNWVHKSLQDLGVETTVEAESDPRLFIGEKKVMGITSTVIGEKNFVSMYILLEHDFVTTAKVLTATDAQSVTKENSIGINQATKNNITIEQVKSAMRARFAEFFGEELNDLEIPDEIVKKQNYNFENVYNTDWWLKYGRQYE